MEAVDAVKSKEQINQIETLLATHNDQYYADLWKVGLNLSLRISDLISLTYEQLDKVDPDSRVLVITEGKTKKKRELVLNKVVLDIVKRRREQHPADTYLFQSPSPRVPLKTSG